MIMIILMEQMGELQIMFDDFFTRALIAGIGIAIIAGVIAAILPAIRASRQNILEAISYE